MGPSVPSTANMLMRFSISTVSASPTRSRASRASGKSVGEFGDARRQHAAQERIVLPRGVERPLKIARFDQILRARHQIGGNGDFLPHLHEQADDQRDEVDRKQQNEQADRSPTI